MGMFQGVVKYSLEMKPLGIFSGGTDVSLPVTMWPVYIGFMFVMVGYCVGITRVELIRDAFYSIVQ
jgi:hypothetical protein